MIDEAFSAIQAMLSQALRPSGDALGGEESNVVLAALSDRDTPGAADLSGKICLTFVNVQKEAAAQATTRRRVGDDTAISAGPLNVNLFMLVSSVPDNAVDNGYQNALTRLSRAMTALQARRILTPQVMPDMAEGIERLTIELVSLDMQELNHLWGNLGGRFLPSALYKIRMVTLEADELRPGGPPITKIGGDLRG